MVLCFQVIYDANFNLSAIRLFLLQAKVLSGQHLFNISMELNALTSISPIDGRYRKQVQHLDEYFSEYGLMKYRIQVNVEFLFLEKEKIL